MNARAWTRQLVGRLGLFPAAYYAFRWLHDSRPSVIARDRRLRREGAPDGLPIPPAGLIYSIASTRDVRWFLEGGERAARSIREALAGVGRPIESFRSLLDFGCGCGRVLRHWRDVRGLSAHGSDYNPAGIAWAREHLPFVEARVNELAPPLPFEDASFDLCYALSVFTHLPAELQRPWIEELRRVVRPGGILILSLHGDAYAPRLSPEDRARYDAGQIVVLQAEHPGTNLCATLHPPAHVRNHLAAGFRLLLHAPEGARGNPRQDLYVFERL